MVAPFNIPAITDTKLFTNEKRDANNTKSMPRRKWSSDPDKLSCFYLCLIVFVLICILLSVLYLFPLKSIPWYKTATLYQVDIHTFQDSDGDGIGDIKGLISKVEYLERHNIKALIVSSLYESEDDGIVNHTHVSHNSGTIEDFRVLRKQLKERNIRLIIDFDPNHTSDKHPWFQASMNGLNSYADYYIWSNSIFDHEQRPPNNWLNAYGESAWTWNEERKQFYLSTFGKHLPDLNLRNPLVRNELKDIIIHWMDEDIDGFRVIAANHLVENSGLFNKPVLMLKKNKKLQHENADYSFIIDQYENLDLLAEWKQILNSYEGERVLIAEISGPPHKTKMYYGNETFPLATLVYNTDFSRIYGNVTGTKLRWYFASLTSDAPSYGWPAWMIGSKTEPRLESRVGDLLDGMHMMAMIAKGTPITYSGDEFGVSTHTSEDNMQISMERESHLNIFSKLLALRNDYALIHGVQQYPIVTDTVFSLMRCYDSKGYLTVVNLGDDPVTLDFTGTSSQLPSEATLMFQSKNIVNSSLCNKEKQTVLLNNVDLAPKHSVLFSYGPTVNVRQKRKRPKV